MNIIGGTFGLELQPVADASCPTPLFLRDDALFFVGARSALQFLTETLAPRTVWMPSYLCPDMFQVIDPRRQTLRFFPIKSNLSVDVNGWIEDVCEGDLVIVIDYFGFPADSTCIAAAKRRGAWVAEDASQALLSTHVGRHADFCVFSPRKFVGVPDGGVLIGAPLSTLPEPELKCPPARWWLKALNVAIQRREFDRHGGSRDWFALFREVESEYPLGRFAMSELSLYVLRCCCDYPAIAALRRANYVALLEHLGDIALFPHLPPNVVPLGFPIRIAQRDRVRRSLFDHEVFPPWHWDIAHAVPPSFRESHELSRDILTLPCDQRYSPDEMCRVVDCLNRARESAV